MKIIQEFKQFAIKGNAVDLAVGVVIGAAFGKIVSSLVDDLINPLLALITGSIDFSDKIIVLREASDNAQALTLNYGTFISTLINFLIIAFAIFIVVKQINKLKRKEEAKPSVPKGPSETELLSEIRDLLRK